MLTTQQLHELGEMYNMQNNYLSPIFTVDDYFDRELTIDELLQIGAEPWGLNFMPLMIHVPLAKKLYVRTSVKFNMGVVTQKWAEMPYVELN